jgi:hypothetical protein
MHLYHVPFNLKQNYFKGIKITLNYILQMAIVPILSFLRISVTSRGNIGDLKHCSYPTIRGFHLIIQHFDTKFTTITPHGLVMFQLQHGQQVKNKL